MTKSNLLLTIVTITLFLSASLYVTAQEENTVEFSLSLENLADPGDDHYEGWLITPDEAVPAGKFTVNDNGDIHDLDGNEIDTFTIDSVSIDDVSDYVITLEPKGDDNTQPSVIKPVAGAFNEDKTAASLSANIDADFSSISGDYILATPTDGNMDTDENSGIWYLSLEGGSPAVGFDLPDLSDTPWIYEGWVIVDGTPLTTGTFDDFNTVDNADPYSNMTADGPPFPGEDYLVNAPSGMSFPLDLAGDMTAITVEPRNDNSPAPFQFHVLEDAIPTGASDHITYQMDDISDTLPTGSVTIVSEESDLATPGITLMLVGFATLVLLSRKKWNGK